jgi:hypothetical protein
MRNGFAATQKSFPLRGRPDVIMISDKPLTPSLERRKTFDSPLANHFSVLMQSSLNVHIFVDQAFPFSHATPENDLTAV